ncbi:hypothetical protein OPV22_017265 [Ensete ventricosum]|uniref:Uncharacterized protein n=1 Tax=Ensete ventricosum TaxID=4639 RepID=A0AAV8PF27_ENSVE|nr:hypothetical protein OPV22_017265 [Ensete ventricosum]
MEGLIPFVYRAILHYAHGEEAPLRNSWLDDSPSASYMRLPGDSGRLRSPEIRLRSSSPSAAAAASATTQSLTRRKSSFLRIGRGGERNSGRLFVAEICALLPELQPRSLFGK